MYEAIRGENNLFLISVKNVEQSKADPGLGRRFKLMNFNMQRGSFTVDLLLLQLGGFLGLAVIDDISRLVCSWVIIVAILSQFHSFSIVVATWRFF